MHKKLLRTIGHKLDRLKNSQNKRKVHEYEHTETKLRAINKRLKA